MPITRKKKMETEDSSNTETTSSETTSGQTTSTSTTETTATEESTVQIENNEETRPPSKTVTAVPDIDRRSACGSGKSRRKQKIAKAKQELLQLQVELAAARLAALEAEDTEDDEDDRHTVISENGIRTWLNTNEHHMLAIANEPHRTEQKRSTERNIEDTSPPIQQEDAIHRSQDASPPFPIEANRPIEDRKIEEQRRPSEYSKKEIDISELATAIAMAAKAGQHSMPRYIADLPSYNGSHQEWLSFRAAYTETAGYFTDTENLARLRRSLTGKAKETVENLLIYSAKPSEIMKMLETRCGRPDAIALSELERLRALAKPTDSARDVCIFATRVSNIVAALRAIGKSHYLNNPEITKATIEKLTPAMRYRWYYFAASQDKEEADLPKLARFLEIEAEMCGPYAQPDTASTPPNRNPSNNPQRRTQKTYTTTTNRSSTACPVCSKSSHPVAECPDFKETDINSRWDLAKEHRLCFRCLRFRNRTHTCRTRKCDTDGCTKSHHKLLHFKSEKQETETKTEAVTSTWTHRNERSYLKIAPVRVTGPKGEVDAYALLDDGSTVTLIDSDLARRTGAKGPIEPLRIEAIANAELSASQSRRVTLTLRGTTQDHRIQARTIDGLQLSPQEVARSDVSGCSHLADIEEHLMYRRIKPQILIGQDNWHLLLATEVRKGRSDQPVASHTPLGWVLHGARTRTLGKQLHSVNNVSTKEDDMDDMLKHYFALESLTITPKRSLHDPEQRAIDLLEEHTRQTAGGHYETALLWKRDTDTLPNNYENAMKRLLTTEKRIDRDPLLKAKYIEQMEALVQKGYAEPTPSNETGKRVWYLPHFPVLNPMKPGKVRVVHDAAAKTRGISLNDLLLTGPDLLQSLPGVLMRFRQHAVAVSADIAEMFMRVKIRQEDRDALRYLWRGDNRNDRPTEYRMTSLIFGATSSPTTAIFVKNLNARKYKETYPEAATAIERNHYMDDYLQSFPTVEEATKTSNEVRYIHRQARFELRQWSSNSRDVLRALNEDSSQDSSININDGTQSERVLGLIWKPEADVLTFNLDMARLPPEVITSSKPTKRDTLKIVMSLFDPLGFASVVTSRAKQILQEIWRRGTGWDQLIDDDLAEQWTDWLANLKNLSKITIPRCYAYYTEASSMQLHVFVDASENAYAAALYWRIERPDGRIDLSLVLAKARVAPLKLTSIPRLELQAAVLGSRMAAAVIAEHDRKPDQRIFWTDSKTVLTWLKTGARSYKPFVAHRIAAIEDNSTYNEWRWVPSRLNVADDATRDVPRDLTEEHRWFRGPEFLRDDPSTWPTEKPKLDGEPTGEERTCHIAAKETPPRLQHCIPNSERFSKYERLLRSTARVLQFIELCRQRVERINYKRRSKNPEKDPTWRKQPKKQDKTMPTTKPPRREERKYIHIDARLLIEAEKLIVRASQEECFAAEIRNLKENKPTDRQSRLYRIAISYEDGMIKLRTRIDAARNIPEQLKRPPVLDGNSRVSKLYIDYIHRKLHHAGVEATINECRQHFWILRLRTITRTTIHSCLQCRIRRSNPALPMTGDHPPSRLAHHRRPFTYTGLDYFGPLTVTVKRNTEKRYVALFTCLTTRAVHLEIAKNLSADSAVMALRRFIARRGCPTEIWSDNGTNLHGANKEIQQSWKEQLENEASSRTIRWRFIPPGAPFMGGAWERLVRSVKTALLAVMTERSPNEEVLNTLLAEVEFTVNSRPLTHVSVNPEDQEAITPNHFLLLGPARTPAPGTFNENDTIGRHHWRASQRLADLFWTRWVREYLPDLQHRREPHGRGTPIQLGDVVLVADGNLPRNTWPRGVVTAVYPGGDGIVRAVDVKTGGGTLRRPTRKLVVIPTTPAVLHADNGASPQESTHGGRDVQNDGQIRAV